MDKSRLSLMQRRFLTQFNVRALLLIMVLTGLSTVYFGSDYRNMRADQAAVNALLSRCDKSSIYTDQVDSNGYYRPGWSILPNSVRRKFFGKRDVYLTDYDGSIRRLARKYPNVTLNTLAQLSSRSASDLKFLTRLDKFEKLDLSDHPCLQRLAGIESQTELKSLNLFRCRQLTSLKGLEKLPRLKSLDIRGCPALKETSCLGSLKHLETLDADQAITKQYSGR